MPLFCIILKQRPAKVLVCGCYDSAPRSPNALKGMVMIIFSDVQGGIEQNAGNRKPGTEVRADGRRNWKLNCYETMKIAEYPGRDVGIAGRVEINQ